MTADLQNAWPYNIIISATPPAGTAAACGSRLPNYNMVFVIGRLVVSFSKVPGVSQRGQKITTTSIATRGLSGDRPKELTLD